MREGVSETGKKIEERRRITRGNLTIWTSALYY